VLRAARPWDLPDDARLDDDSRTRGESAQRAETRGATAYIAAAALLPRAPGRCSPLVFRIAERTRAMKLFPLTGRFERIRPGRMLNSSSPDMGAGGRGGIS